MQPSYSSQPHTLPFVKSLTQNCSRSDISVTLCCDENKQVPSMVDLSPMCSQPKTPDCSPQRSSSGQSSKTALSEDYRLLHLHNQAILDLQTTSFPTGEHKSKTRLCHPGTPQ